MTSLLLPLLSRKLYSTEEPAYNVSPFEFEAKLSSKTDGTDSSASISCDEAYLSKIASSAVSTRVIESVGDLSNE